MKKVLEYIYTVEVEFNEDKNMLYTHIHERKETGNTVTSERSSIPYTTDIKKIKYMEGIKLKRVLEYTYLVDAEFDDENNSIYMRIYERRETGDTSMINGSSIPYITGVDDENILINKWLRTLSKSDMCSMWFLPAKEGFREELKRLLKNNEGE